MSGNSNMYICAKNDNNYYPIIELNLKSLKEVTESPQTSECGGYLKPSNELESLLVQLNQEKIFRDNNSKLENCSNQKIF